MPDHEQESLRTYIRDIKKYPRLTAAEETELGKLSIVGNQNAIEKLVNSNLALVLHAARLYKNKGMDFLDVISEGNIGLMKAATVWDYKRKIRFSTYAYYWIRSQIRAAMSEKIGQVKVPINLNRISNTFYHRLEEMQSETGEVPTKEQIKKKFGKKFKGRRIDDLLEKLERVYFSTNATKESTEYKGQKMGSRGELSIPSFEATLEVCDTNEKLKTVINRMLRNVSKKDKDTLVRYYGLNGHKPETLKQISQKAGLTYQAIDERKNYAFRNLRQRYDIEKFKEYLHD